MAHQLPSLPYAFEALEPHIDAQTMQIHHGKHHQAYINNLNAALEAHPTLQSKSVEDLIKDLNALPEAIRTAVRNNGGGHANHALFWTLMAPNAGGATVKAPPITARSAASTLQGVVRQARPTRSAALAWLGPSSWQAASEPATSSPIMSSEPHPCLDVWSLYS